MPVPRPAACLLLLLSLPACMQWVAREDPVPVLSAEKRPERVRLTLGDGRRIELQNPSVTGDSVRGVNPAGDTANPTTRWVALPLADVRRLEVRQANTTGTMLLMAPVIVGVTYLVGSAWGNSALED